jgi:hypothetical protein
MARITLFKANAAAGRSTPEKIPGKFVHPSSCFRKFLTGMIAVINASVCPLFISTHIRKRVFLFVTSFPLFSPVRRWKCCTIGPNVMNLELPHLTLKNSLTALNKKKIELTCHAASSDNSTEPIG